MELKKMADQGAGGGKSLPVLFVRLIPFYLIVFCVLTAISVLAGFYPVIVSTSTHILFPMLAMLVFGMRTRFGYIKLNTLILGRIVIILAALGWGDRYIHWLCLILLQLNILEAVLIDWKKGFYFSAGSGLLLLISSFTIDLGWSGSFVFLENDNYILWIVAYTLWNANFVTLQLSGAYFTHHYLILLAPIAACLVLSDFSYWLVFRETTLLLGIATLTCVKGKLLKIEGQPPFLNVINLIQSFTGRRNTQILLMIIIGAFAMIQLESVLHG